MSRAHTSKEASGRQAAHAQPLPDAALADCSPAVLALQRDQQMADGSPLALQMRQRADMLSASPASGALARYQRMAGSAARLPVQQRVIQRFSDATNDTRRSVAEGSTGVDMQLDHAISQDTMKKFHSIIPMLKSIPKGVKPSNLASFLTKAEALFNEQGISLEGNPYLNLRNNLTPGFTNTLQNPGNRFDPQVKVNGADVVVSEQSEHLEMMERAMRSIYRKTDIIKVLGSLDEETTAEFRAELDSDLATLNAALDYLKASGEQPAYDASHWYDYNGKKVKKVGATYLAGHDGRLATLGSRKARRYSPKTIVQFVNVRSYSQTNGKHKRLETRLVPLTVTVTVPEATWKHIYERHTIDYFAWDIQAVNTFWKFDPQVLFMNFQEEIVAELLLIIDRQMDLEHEISQAKRGKDSAVTRKNVINESGSAFFFQGGYTFEEMSTEPDDLDAEYEPFAKDELAIVLKSFAPQSADFAYAVLPSALAARKPAQ